MPALVISVALAVALTTVIVGLVAAVILERARRHDLAKRVDELQAEARARDARLAALERVDRNPLYREALEDQRARQLRAADDVSTGVEFMLQAIRTLAPEMLKKGKRQ